jgi:transcriptional regulator with XRE-family HTH domain
MNKSEQKSGTERSVPIYPGGIGTRIRWVAKQLGTREEAARVADKSKPQIDRYIREDNLPGVDTVVALADAAQVSVEWLATGRETLERAKESAPHLFRRRDEAAVTAQAAGEDAWFDERLEEIERMLEQEPDTPVPTARLEANELLSQALTDVRRIAQNPEAPAKQRTRAATIGELAFGDEDLGRLREELARPTTQQKMQRFQRISDDLASVATEIGYDPPLSIREALKTAMYHHGLTREGAAVLLQFISAELEQRSKDD